MNADAIFAGEVPADGVVGMFVEEPLGSRPAIFVSILPSQKLPGYCWLAYSEPGGTTFCRTSRPVHTSRVRWWLEQGMTRDFREVPDWSSYNWHVNRKRSDAMYFDDVDK